MTTEARASILIVDDTVENLRLLVSILGDRGYEPRPVTNGSDALRAAEQAAPDLILLDITMPEMNGFEVCRALKARPALMDIPVIFLTALTDVQDKVNGFAAGGVDFITKPFHVDEVLARVASQVALRRARQELADSLDRLQSLERLRDDLVHMMMHDMRGLLTVVISYLDLVLPDLTGEVATDVAQAQSAAHAVARMANTVLDVSRLEAGKMPVKRANADVASLAADAARNFGAMDSSRTITCTASGPVMATCDADLVRRVIENLVSNAIKHTPSGGNVTVDVRVEDGELRVAVQDEGRGVAEEVRATLFEKFAAVNKASRSHSAGLGLAFCKLAVEAHGGTIGVRPATPKGSIFSFALPAEPAGGTPETQAVRHS
jgi:two-component system sensor histidine kinase/response regulator